MYVQMQIPSVLRIVEELGRYSLLYVSKVYTYCLKLGTASYLYLFWTNILNFLPRMYMFNFCFVFEL